MITNDVYKDGRRVGTVAVGHDAGGVYGYVVRHGRTVTLTPEECDAPGQVLDVMFGNGWTYDVPKKEAGR